MAKDNKLDELDKILMKHARWATDLIDLPRHQYPDATLDPKQAKQALTNYILDQRIDELRACLSNVPMPILSYEQVENRIKELEEQKQ